MTLPSSGSLSLSQVQGEHGGSLPLSMSQLLRGAASGLVHSSNTAIPAAAPMSLSQFRGTSRFGRYPITVGRWLNGSAYQQGFNVNTGGGAISFNRNYRGYTISAIAWNEETDGLVAVALLEQNVPQSVLTSFSCAKLGTRSQTGYFGNFLGSSLFLFGTTSTSPFSAVGTVDNSIILL